MTTKTYVRVFFLLAILTAVTVMAARVQLGTGVALLIASIKASLVGLFFMHLRDEGRMTAFIVLFPVFLFVILLVLILPDFR